MVAKSHCGVMKTKVESCRMEKMSVQRERLDCTNLSLSRVMILCFGIGIKVFYLINVVLWGSVLRMIYSMLYFFWVHLPLRLFQFVRFYISTAFRIVYRRSDSFRTLYEHLNAFLGVLSGIRANNKLSECIIFTIATVIEVRCMLVLLMYTSLTFPCLLQIFIALFWPYASSKASLALRRVYVDELSQLVAYEEDQRDSTYESGISIATKKSIMHNDIPFHPFKATVRVVSKESSEYFDLMQGMQADSPTSFPTTPSSRATVM